MSMDDLDIDDTDLNLGDEPLPDDLGSDISEALLAWVNTFSEATGNEAFILDDLSDGLILFDLLALLEPTHFDIDDLKKTDADGVAASFVSQMLESLGAFLDGEMGNSTGAIAISDIDVQAVEQASADEIVKILELVLLCAINSEKKEDAIGNIMTLEDSAQTQLMFVCNDIMARFSAPQDITRASAFSIGSIDDSRTASEAVYGDDQSADQIDSLMTTVSELKNEREDLDDRLVQLQKEHNTLKTHHETLKREHDMQLTDKDAQVEQHIQQAIAAIKKEEEEKRKLDSIKSDRRVRQSEQEIEEMTDSIRKLENALRKREDDLKAASEENHRLHDELDLASEKAQSLDATENMLQRYKKKLEEMGSMKNQLQDSEQQMGENMERIMELETEVSKISPLKEKINKLKSRVVDLKSEITEYKSTEDRQKQEIDQLKKTVSAAKKENGFIAQQLEDKKAELAVAASKAANVEPPSPMHGLGGLNDGMSSMERYKRLEIENKKLKAELAQRKAGKGDNTKNSDSDDELADELDMAQRIAKSNEEKYLGSQRKVRELELEVKKITEQSKKKIAAAMAAARRSGDSDKKDVMDGSSDDKTDAGATPVPASSAEYEDMKKKMTSEQSKKEALLTRNKKLEVYIKQLQRKLKDKEQRLAKTVNQGVTYSEALKTLRKQVKDREAEIQEREKIRLDAKHATAREQRLVSAAFYEIGMEFQTMLLKMGGRNGGENTSQRSWINKQRAKLSGGGNSGRGNGDLL